MTEPTTDNHQPTVGPTAKHGAATATVGAVAAATAGQVVASFPGGDALRDYGQRLSETLRVKGQELAAEPAKRRALWPVAVAAVAGLLAARDALLTSPAAARAGRPPLYFVQASRETSENRSALAAGPSATRSPLRAWLDEPINPVNRNIFTTARSQDTGGAEFAPAVAKSQAGSVDSNQRQEVRAPVSVPSAAPAGHVAASDVAPGRRPNVQARQIRLQSTLMGGPQPAALINGQMVREGDVVATTGSGASRTSYRVLKIEARRVILEREGIRSEIPLE